MTTTRIVCRQHVDSVVTAYHPEQDLAAGIQLYKLAWWPYLLKTCDCPDRQVPPRDYEPLTPAQVRQWMESHE